MIVKELHILNNISIHALREESDMAKFCINMEQIIMRCDSDSGKKLIKSMVLRTADRQGMC